MKPFANLAISTYCPVAPTGPAFSTQPIIYTQTVGSSAVYSCINGYLGAPITNCTTFNTTTGQWTSFSGNCSCTVVDHLIACFSQIRTHKLMILYDPHCSDLKLLSFDSANLSSKFRGSRIIFQKHKRHSNVQLLPRLLGESIIDV